MKGADTTLARSGQDVVAARRISVTGVVQGVGFRPFVWRLAQRVDVTGLVRNEGGRVEIVAEGDDRDLDRFCAALSSEAPPRARVARVEWASVRATGRRTFEIDSSRDHDAPGPPPLVPPDIATCDACLAELFDPTDRRFGYAFLNCVDCGPRFTVIRALPYDRSRTSMRAFALCPECAREYEDPGDRRYHAEPVACPTCGPTLELRNALGDVLVGDPIERAARLLREGRIVAVKGLGGFHLACDATDERAVAELRRRKHRPRKPFAVMVADLDEAGATFALSPGDAALLGSWRAPIVLTGDAGRLAPSVAPGHRRQGAMLPATPLHHLLLRAAGRPLVMTSGNRSDEPICTTNTDAFRRLGDIADAFVLHDREIVARYDDSVMAVRRGAPAVLRRARSVAPEPITLPANVDDVLACGAELQTSFCLARGTNAYVSQHLGDLDSDEAFDAYREAVDRHRGLFRVEPRIVAHDLHPDFLTTRFAESLGLPRVAVQHHHAHVAAVMAEHRLHDPVLGVAFDGFGLGEDGSAWGGEFLACDWATSRRVGHLRAVPQPGGDAAVRQPALMAVAHAYDAGCLDGARVLLGPDGPDVDAVAARISAGLATTPTSSAGRLLDAVAALAGLCRQTTFEGEPAILLEQAADPVATGSYPVDVEERDDQLVVDTRPIIGGVVAELRTGVSVGAVARRCLRTLGAAVVDVCARLRDRTGLDRVCLAGGVWADDLLLDDVVADLEARRFSVFWPRALPPGDGGLSVGQALVAHARTSARPARSESGGGD